MKHYLLLIALLLTLGFSMPAAAQKHRHTPVKSAVTTPQNSPDSMGVEAFSDTTSVAADDSLTTYTQPHSYSVNVTTPVDQLLSDIDGEDLMGMLFVLTAIALVFVLAPVLIIIAVFYFINKSRKDRLKLAQMAIQKGQPMPEQLLRKSPAVNDLNLRSGIKQVFLGVGLMILLWIIIGKLGLGIGALVFFIGLGKVVIALLDKQSIKNDEPQA